jgi:Holliday junction resolvasome RuvABC endonuclease subunit
VSAVILGIDGGLASLGWAAVSVTGSCIVGMGVIHTSKTDKKRRVLASDDNVRRVDVAR